MCLRTDVRIYFHIEVIQYFYTSLLRHSMLFKSMQNQHSSCCMFASNKLLTLFCWLFQLTLESHAYFKNHIVALRWLVKAALSLIKWKVPRNRFVICCHYPLELLTLTASKKICNSIACIVYPVLLSAAC